MELDEPAVVSCAQRLGSFITFSPPSRLSLSLCSLLFLSSRLSAQRPVQEVGGAQGLHERPRPEPGSQQLHPGLRGGSLPTR